jgi:TonB family protein
MKTFSAFVAGALAVCHGFAASQSNPDLQPIGITHSLDQAFPESLAHMYPNGGEARILVTIRSDGELGEWLVTAYSAPEFKEQAVAALKEIKFSPARYKGESIAARSEITLTFETRGMLVSSSASMDSFALGTRSPGRLSGFEAIPLSKLDRAPAVLKTVSPRYPKELADRGLVGSVVVDFFIDEAGDVKMPSVLEPEANPLADAAVNAIRQWKFETPVYRGKPALVHARQVFNFDPTARSGC